jgi:hypothetical protein
LKAALNVLAKHFTEEEDAASTAERQVGKSADAIVGTIET